MSSPDGSEQTSPAGTTTPETTTTTSQTTTTTTETTTTTASSSGDSTTASPTETTTPSSSEPSDGTVPTVQPTTFRCYLKEPPTYVENSGFKIGELYCNIPEATTTPETTTTTTTTVETTTTTAAGGRMLAESKIEVKIEGKDNVKCEGTKGENRETKFICSNNNQKFFYVNDNKFTAVYSTEYKSVVYVACKLGNEVIIEANKEDIGESCPSPLEGDDAYNTTCIFDITKIGTGNEYRLTNNNLTCNCPNTAEYNGRTFIFSSEDVSNGQNRVGSTEQVKKKCKTSGEIVFQCKSTGWEYISGVDSCNDDGAISSTVSSILLGIIMILAIIF